MSSNALYDIDQETMYQINGIPPYEHDPLSNMNGGSFINGMNLNMRPTQLNLSGVRSGGIDPLGFGF